MENDRRRLYSTVEMRTRQQPNEERPPSAAFASGAGVVRGRHWSAGAQLVGEGGTSCTDFAENKTNGSLQKCQPWIAEEDDNMMMNDAAMSVNDGPGESELSHSAAQGHSREFRRTQRRRMVVTSTPAKNAFLFAIISFLFLASLAPPSSMSSTSLIQGTSTASIFGGFHRFAAYAEDAEEEEDDDFTDPIESGDISIDNVSVMPVSCLRYNNGHMIKFELFENSSSYQCHFKNLGTYVVSIAHFMRAYFNHQALLKGHNFKL